MIDVTAFGAGSFANPKDHQAPESEVRQWGFTRRRQSAARPDGMVRWLSSAWRRPLVGASVDGAVWALSLVLATAARYMDVPLDGIELRGLLQIVLLAAGAQVLSGLVSGLYLGRWVLGSFDEFGALVRSVTLTTAVVFAADTLLQPQPVPKSSVLGAGFMALVLAAGSRYLWRLQYQMHRRPATDRATGVLVFGAGEGGTQVIAAMLTDPSSPYRPVGLLDDDPTKQSLRVRGVPVVGTRDTMARAASQLGAGTLLIAIPSADARLISDLSSHAEAAGLEVKVLPSVRDLLDGRAGVDDIRDVEMADLLGRRPVETDLDAIASYLTGQRVMVTGAGGSIGSQLCREIAKYNPAELIMVDRDESGLHATQLSIEGRALLEGDSLVLADVRDVERLARLFLERRPDVVFHAAALKHLPLLEAAPGEAVKTNVWGTIAVLNAAAAADVKRFVNISTDKAADPVSVLGYSKRIGERLTAHFGQQTGAAYLSVRFGNVLGSRGSVLTVFKAQLEAGERLTVTHPDVTRYFMLIQEAVELVIQAGAIGRSGEALVLDMGEPVRIADVARRLAGGYDTGTELEYTGLRPGEKLHEVLLGADEVDSRPHHPHISQVRVPPLNPVDALALDPWNPHETVIAEMRELCQRHWCPDIDLTIHSPRQAGPALSRLSR